MIKVRKLKECRNLDLTALEDNSNFKNVAKIIKELSGIIDASIDASSESKDKKTPSAAIKPKETKEPTHSGILKKQKGSAAGEPEPVIPKSLKSRFLKATELWWSADKRKIVVRKQAIQDLCALKDELFAVYDEHQKDKFARIDQEHKAQSLILARMLREFGEINADFAAQQKSGHRPFEQNAYDAFCKFKVLREAKKITVKSLKIEGAPENLFEIIEDEINRLAKALSVSEEKDTKAESSSSSSAAPMVLDDEMSLSAQPARRSGRRLKKGTKKEDALVDPSLPSVATPVSSIVAPVPAVSFPAAVSALVAVLQQEASAQPQAAAPSSLGSANSSQTAQDPLSFIATPQDTFADTLLAPQPPAYPGSSSSMPSLPPVQFNLNFGPTFNFNSYAGAGLGPLSALFPNSSFASDQSLQFHPSAPSDGSSSSSAWMPDLPPPAPFGGITGSALASSRSQQAFDFSSSSLADPFAQAPLDFSSGLSIGSLTPVEQDAGDEFAASSNSSSSSAVERHPLFGSASFGEDGEEDEFNFDDLGSTPLSFPATGGYSQSSLTQRFGMNSRRNSTDLFDEELDDSLSSFSSLPRFTE